MKRTAPTPMQLRLRRAVLGAVVLIGTAWLTATIVGWLAGGIAYTIH